VTGAELLTFLYGLLAAAFYAAGTFAIVSAGLTYGKPSRSFKAAVVGCFVVASCFFYSCVAA